MRAMIGAIIAAALFVRVLYKQWKLKPNGWHPELDG